MEASVIDRFEEVATFYKNRTALDDGNLRLTYGELAEITNRIAWAIHRATKGNDGPVAILLEQEARFPAAILGVMRGGRACVPLDASFPVSRNRLIVDHSGAVAMITSGNLFTQAKELVTSGAPPIIDLDVLETASPDELPPRPVGSDLSYILYTSGSSGTPKGVFFNHKNTLFVVENYTQAARITCEDRVGLLHSPSVGVATRSIYPALLNGASLHVLAPRRLGAAGLADAIRKQRITVLYMVPRLFRQMVAAMPNPEYFDTVRSIHFSGDQIEWSDVEKFRAFFPANAKLIAALGSTECGAICEWVVTGDSETIGSHLPIGRDLPERCVTLVDEQGRLVPDGEPGEMIVTGRYLARGYWKEPELTAAAFRSDPSDEEKRSFHTGDIARRRTDGLLEFLGRSDEQVKLRGFRVEIGDIEAALRHCKGVEDAAVVIRRREEDKVLSVVAYVVLSADHQSTTSDISNTLDDLLPEHMVPAAIYVIDSMPLLETYKIDRQKLARMDAERKPALPMPSSAPIESVLEVFVRVLNVSSATDEDTAFSLGGDSLEAAMIAVELEERFSVQIPPDILYNKTGTIRRIAEWIFTSSSGRE